MVKKRVWNASTWMQSQKWQYEKKNDRIISVHFQGKPFNIKVIQAYAPTVMLKKLKLNSSMKTYKTF